MDILSRDDSYSDKTSCLADTQYMQDYTATITSPDQDGDGVIDTSDNCPAVANADQKDTDNDGTGDACDSVDNSSTDVSSSASDDDGDGLGDDIDECPDRADEGYGVMENGCPPHVVVPPANIGMNWQFGDDWARVYDHADGVAVYCSTGALAMHISSDVVANAPDVPQDVPILEYNENGCHVAFYMLDDGKFQINIWSPEGKLYEMIADNFDFSDHEHHYYDPNE